MRGLQFSLRHTWFEAVGGSKYLLMYCVLRNAQRDEITVHISEKGGWSTHVKVGSDGDSQLLQTRAAPASLNVGAVTGRVSWIWVAVRYGRMTSGNGGQEFSGLLSKDMLLRAASSMDPPHVPWRFCASCRKSVQHGKNWGDPNSGAQ